MQVEIGNPNEIEDIYDGVSYSKGASVNGMVYAYLGHDRFREALRAYLKKFQYSNAVTKDLWQAMSDASGEDIAAHMKRFAYAFLYSNILSMFQLDWPDGLSGRDGQIRQDDQETAAVAASFPRRWLQRCVSSAFLIIIQRRTLQISRTRCGIFPSLSARRRRRMRR